MKTDNRAVVERRYSSPENFDDYPTPPWATRALIEHVLKPHLAIHDFRPLSVWEPAANRGFMSRPLGEYFGRVIETDIFDYGRPNAVRKFDFLDQSTLNTNVADWIITNPPFSRFEAWAQRAFKTLGVEGVALLARTAVLESVNRWGVIFEYTPPSIVAQFTERVPMFQGRIDPKGSTATSYCWLIWRRRDLPVYYQWEPPECCCRPSKEFVTRLVWIPPCRKELERPWDY